MIRFESQGVHYQFPSLPLSLRQREARNAKLIGPIPKERVAKRVKKKLYRRTCRWPTVGYYD